MAMAVDNSQDEWCRKPLGEVAPIDTTAVLPTETPRKNFFYIALENIESGTGRLVGSTQAKGESIKSNKFQFGPEHVLLGKLRPYLNKVFIPDQTGICSTDILPLKPDSKLLMREFLGWCLRSPDFVGYSSSKMEGGKMPRLRTPDLECYEIPVPPLAEQRRIVARVEGLTRRLDQARQARQAALAEAQTVFTAELDRQFNHDFISKYSSLNLEEVAEIRSGVTLGRKLEGQTVSLPYLRVANVQDGHLDLREIKTVSILEREREKWQLRSGELLLTEGGDWDKLGRGTIWRSEIPDCIHQNHIFRVRVNAPDLEPTFVAALVWSPYGKAYFQAASKQTTNLASINQAQLRAFRVCRPPLAEQRTIVARLDAMRGKLDELQRLQREVEAELASFTPALLAKAFRGEL
jgi:type I restriction enzyme S subunit